jgi:hypothetical protein
MLVQVGQPGFNNRSFVGEHTSLPCDFSFDVVLQDALSFLLVSHQLLREGFGVAVRCGFVVTV